MNMRVPFPPVEMQRRFAELVKKLDLLEQQVNQSELHSRTLFNAIQQQAFAVREQNSVEASKSLTHV